MSETLTEALAACERHGALDVTLEVSGHGDFLVAHLQDGTTVCGTVSPDDPALVWAVRYDETGEDVSGGGTDVTPEEFAHLLARLTEGA